MPGFVARGRGPCSASGPVLAGALLVVLVVRAQDAPHLVLVVQAQDAPHLVLVGGLRPPALCPSPVHPASQALRACCLLLLCALLPKPCAPCCLLSLRTLLPFPLPQIEEGVEAFVEAQIIKIDDNKWGNKLSQVGSVLAAACCCYAVGCLDSLKWWTQRVWGTLGLLHLLSKRACHRVPTPALAVPRSKLSTGRELVVHEAHPRAVTDAPSLASHAPHARRNCS